MVSIKPKKVERADSIQLTVSVIPALTTLICSKPDCKQKAVFRVETQDIMHWKNPLREKTSVDARNYGFCRAKHVDEFIDILKDSDKRVGWDMRFQNTYLRG